MRTVIRAGLVFACVWAASFAVFLLPVPNAEATSFWDVPDDHPYAAAIRRLYDLRIIDGKGARRFDPDGPATRAQFCKMVVNTVGLPVDESMKVGTYFDDAGELGPDDPNTLYPHQYIAAAINNRITLGYHPVTGGSFFRPYISISRIQVTNMVLRGAWIGDRLAYMLPPTQGYPHTWNIWWVPYDFPLMSYHRAVGAAETNGFFTSLPLADLDMWKSMTRGEIAQVLANLLDCYERTPAPLALVNGVTDDGALLAYVWTENPLFCQNEYPIYWRHAMPKASMPNVSRLGDFASSLEGAVVMRSAFGVWAYPPPSPPQTPLYMSDTNLRDDSPDAVILWARKDVNLAGYRIEDTDGHSHPLPNVTVAQKWTFHIHSGTGINTSTDLYLGIGDSVWRGTGVVYLLNPEGYVVAARNYYPVD